MSYEWKNIGETPNDVLKRFRKRNNIGEEVRACFVGRLDPMAQGVIPILVGDECKKMDEYMKHDKTYEVEAVIGVRTDTYDPMGLPVECDQQSEIETYIGKILELEERSFEQKYPPYSAFPIRIGKEKHPMWYWALAGKLPEVTPSKSVTVYEARQLTEPTKVRLYEYLEEIKSEIMLVEGERFRQEEIIAAWSKLANIELSRVKFRFKVSAGTYIRSLINSTNVPAHAHRITRTECHAIKVD